MPRTGQNIYKRKDGRWEGRYIKNHEGHKTSYGYIYGRTYKEVKCRLLKVHTECQPENAKLPSPTEDVLFVFLAEKWFEHSRLLFKESTCVKYRNLLRCYIIPHLGSHPVNDITDETVLAFANDLLTSGGEKGSGLSPKTVSDILSVLRSIRKYAISRNIDIKYLSCSLPVKQKSGQLRVFSMQEQQKLYSYLKSNISLRNLGIMLCLFTGLRIGELCALRWEDISLKSRTLYVHQTMQRLHVRENSHKQQKETKTAILISTPKSSCSIRIIPIPELLLKELRLLKQPSDAFFLTGEKADYIEPRTMQNHFKSVLKECHIDDANFHTLRHTFATRCVEVAFDTKSLSEILGHANVSITLNRYVHPTLELKQENMNRLSKLFDSDSPSKSPSDGNKGVENGDS